MVEEQKGRGAKVKDGIISETKFLGTISVDCTTFFERLTVIFGYGCLITNVIFVF
jgi:hypothetical protein